MFPRRRRTELPGIAGVVRVDRSTAALAARLRPGELAVLDHLDLDGGSAQLLVSRGVSAVVNVSPSLSGRHPALGAGVLVAAGIPLVDEVGAGIFARVRDGQRVRLDVGLGALVAGGEEVARGRVQTPETVALARAAARDGLAAQVGCLVGDLTETLLTEADLLLDGPPAPLAELDAAAGAPVLLVGQGPQAVAEVLAVAGWVGRARPLVVAVDEGLTSAYEAGLAVDVVVGDLVGLPPAAVAAAGVVVVRNDAGVDRAAEAGRSAARLATGLPPLAAALAALAAARPALVVAAGVPGGLDDLLDAGRRDAAATLVARLRCDGLLVDARAVSALAGDGRARRSSPGSQTLPVLLVLLAALVAALAILAVSDPGRAVLHRLGAGGGW